MDGHGTGGDINPINPTTFSEGQNTHGVQQDGGVMMNPNNNNSLPMARCNSLDDMDGIEWDENSGQGDDLGLLFWDELGGGGGSSSTNNIDYSLNNIMDPASGGYPLIDGMGDQQQQQQLQQQGQQLQQQQGIVNNDMILMANLIDDAIGIQGQDQSGGGSALLGGILSHMPSFNSIAPPPPPTANATAATGISSAECKKDESTSQDFSNIAAPPSGEDNQPPRIEDGINQSQQVGTEEQKTNPATSALDSVAAESFPQGPVEGPVVNVSQDNESPPLADGTNFVTASTIASAESQSFSSIVNNTANNNAVQGQIYQTTVNAKWPSQQEQEQQAVQQAQQQVVQPQVQQQIQATQQQLMMNAMLTNPAQMQAINPQAYYLWLCQQAQQPVQAPGIIQGQDIASSTTAAATAVQQPTVAISQLMLQLQAQQQQASQQQVHQSRLLQASQALAVHQSQLQQAAQLQAAAAQRQVPQAALPASSTTAGNSINNYKPISSIPPGQKKKTATIVHRADPSSATQRRMSGGSVGSYQPRAVTATPHHTAQNNNAASSSIIPHAAPSAGGMVQPTNKFPMVSASDTDATLAQHPPKKKAKRGGGGSFVLSSSAGEYSTADEGLTPEQRRIKHNRERNREHAKNTRIRKKEYVERLKISVDELCRERDNLVSERATAASLMVEVHSKRVDVLRSFFALRASYSVSQKRELWSSILDESSFTCRLPVTPYQSFPSSEVQVSNCQRTIAGVDSMIGDAAANYVFLDSIVDRGQYPDGKIKFQYTLVTEESVVSGNQLMARWAMSTLNAKKCGANTELHQRGMLICKFNSAHKIVNLEIMFDVMALMLQVKMAMGYNNFNDVVIPNTVQNCGQKVYDYPMVMTLANRPYTIVQANERWENLTGYKKHEVVGKRSCSILQQSNGSSDASASRSRSRNRKDMNQLMGPVLFQRPSCAMVVNYTKTGRRFRQYVTIYPLSTDSNVTHYFGLTTFVQWLDQNDENKDFATAKKPPLPPQATKNTNNTKDGSSQESSSSTSINPNSTSSSNNTISSTDAVAPSDLKSKEPSK